MGSDHGEAASASATFKAVGTRLRNWGRWGADDQLGTVNHLTDARRASAARLVRTGEIVELGMPFSSSGPQVCGPNQRFNPIHRMIMLPTDRESPSGQVVSDDMIIMPLQAATQWDSLAHVGYDGYFYNGVPITAVTAIGGATRNSVDHVVGRLVGRGVLLDLPSLKGVDALAPGEEVRAEDLSAAATAQDVRIEPGDIVLIRTGWYRHFLEPRDGLSYLGPRVPGLGLDCCEWLHSHEVAAVAADNPFLEVRPSPLLGSELPVHMVLIRDMGMTLGEMFNLEALAAGCSSAQRWEFLFCGVGLAVTHAVGAPVTPVAVL